MFRRGGPGLPPTPIPRLDGVPGLPVMLVAGGDVRYLLHYRYSVNYLLQLAKGPQK